MSLQSQMLVSAGVVLALLALFSWRFARTPVWLGAFVAVFLIDQACKVALVPVLRGQPPVILWGGSLWLTYAENRFQGFGGSSPAVLLLTLCSVPMILRLHVRLRQLHYRMSYAAEVAAGCVLGGLTAIAYDRAAAGYVIDFIQFGPAGAFVYNPADFAVLAAGALVVLRTLQLAATGRLRQLAAVVGEG